MGQCTGRELGFDTEESAKDNALMYKMRDTLGNKRKMQDVADIMKTFDESEDDDSSDEEDGPSEPSKEKKNKAVRVEAPQRVKTTDIVEIKFEEPEMKKETKEPDNDVLSTMSSSPAMSRSPTKEFKETSSPVKTVRVSACAKKNKLLPNDEDTGEIVISSKGIEIIKRNNSHQENSPSKKQKKVQFRLTATEDKNVDRSLTPDFNRTLSNENNEVFAFEKKTRRGYYEREINSKGRDSMKRRKQ